MNAPRRIRTMIVSVPVEAVGELAANGSRTTSARCPRFRPSDLLPWSDPYIASLVTKLQAEVREAHAAARGRLAGEAEMPWNEPFEYDSEDDRGFSIDPEQLLRQ